MGPPKVSVKTIKVYQPSSFRLFSLKNKTVYSGHTNSSCTGSTGNQGKENNIGRGPGDNTPSVDPTFKGGLLRLPQKGKKGVDKKHGSYERYLAKKVHNVSLTCA